MKRLLILFILLSSLEALAQDEMTPGFGYGARFQRLAADSFFRPPVLPDTSCALLESEANGTCFGAIIFLQTDSTLYQNVGYWRPLGKLPGGVLDSARRSNDTLYFRTSSGLEIAVKMEGIAMPGVVGLQDSLNTRYISIPNVDSLRTKNGNITPHVILEGYYTINDGGGGKFRWVDTSTAADNGGTIFSVSGITTGRWHRVYNKGWVNVRWFGAKGDYIADDATALEAASATLENVFVPKGTYKVLSTITARGFQTWKGEGWDAVIRTPLNISIFKNAVVPGSFIQQFILQDLQISNVYPVVGTLGQSEYQVDLVDPLMCEVQRCWIRSAFTDSQYNILNRGGVRFYRSGIGGFVFMNRVVGSLLQACSIHMGTTDSKITSNFCWGHTMGEGSINVKAGNISIEDNDIIPSVDSGGINITGVNGNNTRIVNNFFDGSNPPVNSNYGVMMDSARDITITGNSFWAIKKGGIRLKDAQGIAIIGNTFENNDEANAGNADILVEGADVSPTQNVISGNIFNRIPDRANKGYAIEERNSGFAPNNNNYSMNSARGFYLSPRFLLLSPQFNLGNKGSSIGYTIDTVLSVNAGSGVSVPQGYFGNSTAGYWNFNNAGSPTTRVLLRAYNSAATETIRFDPASNSFFNSGGNLGVGTNSPTSRLHVAGSLAAAITTVTGSTTLDVSHGTVLVNNSGSITITLPAANGCIGREYAIKKISANSNDVVIDGNGAESIDNAPTKTMTLQWSSVVIRSNGTGWFIIASHAAATTL